VFVSWLVLIGGTCCRLFEEVVVVVGWGAWKFVVLRFLLNYFDGFLSKLDSFADASVRRFSLDSRF